MCFIFKKEVDFFNEFCDMMGIIVYCLNEFIPRNYLNYLNCK